MPKTRRKKLLKPSQGLFLNLSYAFSGQIELGPDFLQRTLRAVRHPETHAQDGGLAWRKQVQRLVEREPQLQIPIDIERISLC